MGFVRSRGRRLRRAGRRRPALAPAASRERELRGGGGVPDGVPHRVDPAHAARQGRLRRTRPRHRGCGSGGHGRGPAREGAERPARGRRRQRGEARAHALARRRRGGDLRGDSASSSRSTPCSTSSAATSSPRRSRSLKPLGTAIAVGYAGGLWQDVSPTLARRPEHRRARLLPRPPDRRATRISSSRRAATCSGSGKGARPAGRRCRVPARAGGRGAPADRGAKDDRKGGSRFRDGAGDGLRRRHRERDRREASRRGVRGQGAGSRERVRRHRPECVGAHRLGRPRLPQRRCPHRRATTSRNLTDDQYRRAVGVNVDGVVFGVRRLDRVMPTGSTIVVTASLAGLTAIPDDPIYGLTKHAVVGFVRSVAPQLQKRGIRIQAVCPGWADTGLLTTRLQAGARRARLPAARAFEGRRRQSGLRTRAREPARPGSSSPAASRCTTSSRASPAPDSVGEPMVPPRAPSFRITHQARFSWPPGRQSRPPARTTRVSALS